MDSRKEKYLDKIVEHLVNRTKYDTDHLNLYIIKFPFSNSWEVFGSDREMSSIYDISPERFGIYRWNFDQEMIEVFDLIEHEADYVWEKYFEGARFFGNEYAKSDGLINESIEDKQKKYLIENYVKTEKFKNNVEKLLNQELELLIQEDWIDEESIKEINSVESIVVDEVIRNVGIFDLVVFITLNIGNNGSRYTPIYNNYGGIINYLGDKIREIIPNLKVNFKINYIDNQLSEQIESNSDKQTKYLKKVVDIMMRDTKPFNKSVASVITPFIASPSKNGKYVLSANYCKNMVDYFDDQFRLGKIFNDYLEMFGLSYEEMEEVMYWYFNDVYEKYFKRFFDLSYKTSEKYFKRFFDLSYKTRPRLDESVDLGFVDKVVDMVLKEIVWDFDRGLVYFPMIDYSASIRDDDFLSAVSADDAFTNDISSPNTNWHVDLMKHIEDTYGITVNEWGRVWGSLQGEIWDKTDKYWDSFTRGY